MDRSWPPLDIGDQNAVEPGVAKITFPNLPAVQGFTIAVSRQGVELAGTTPCAIATAKLLTYDAPIGLCWCIPGT